MLKISFKKNVLPNFQAESGDPVVVDKELTEDTTSPEFADFLTTTTTEDEEEVPVLNILNPVASAGEGEPIPILITASLTTKAELTQIIAALTALSAHMIADEEPG